MPLAWGHFYFSWPDRLGDYRGSWKVYTWPSERVWRGKITQEQKTLNWNLRSCENIRVRSGSFLMRYITLGVLCHPHLGNSIFLFSSPTKLSYVGEIYSRWDIVAIKITRQSQIEMEHPMILPTYMVERSVFALPPLIAQVCVLWLFGKVAKKTWWTDTETPQCSENSTSCEEGNSVDTR